MVLVSAALLSGCAAYTNPVANGIPVRMLPDQLLAESRENFEPIDLAILRQPPPESFKLDVGDTLGVYIEGIIGDENTPPPCEYGRLVRRTTGDRLSVRRPSEWDRFLTIGRSHQRRRLVD